MLNAGGALNQFAEIAQGPLHSDSLPSGVGSITGPTPPGKGWMGLVAGGWNSVTSTFRAPVAPLPAAA
jgi:hypothetical protein